MSCSNCPCEECQEDRDRDRAFARRNDDADVPQYINQHWSNVEPGTPEQQKVWLGYLNEIFDVDHPGLKVINLSTALYLVAGKIPGLRPENSRKVLAQVERTIRESSMFQLRKGAKGGLFRTAEACGPKKTAVPELDLPIQRPAEVVNVPPSNDHTCPTCGNNKVSKDERSCWKCGGSLH